MGSRCRATADASANSGTVGEVLSGLSPAIAITKELEQVRVAQRLAPREPQRGPYSAVSPCPRTGLGSRGSRRDHAHSRAGTSGPTLACPLERASESYSWNWPRSVNRPSVKERCEAHQRRSSLTFRRPKSNDENIVCA
jgi:hypothetical protein